METAVNEVPLQMGERSLGNAGNELPDCAGQDQGITFPPLSYRRRKISSVAELVYPPKVFPTTQMFPLPSVATPMPSSFERVPYWRT